MATPLITSAFARIGDTRNPPQTDPNGSVNWDNGYTPNYEIDLSSGDPLAKAVERDVMNYLFNILTDNARQYQKNGNPEWYSNMPNGYPIGAIVLVAITGGFDLYRSLANNNTSNPVGSSAWDKIWTSAQLRGIIPMPLGGQQYISGGLVPAGTDIKSLTDGTYIVATDSIAAQVVNLPIAKAGMLEVKKFSAGGQPASVYRYNATSNDSYWLIDGPGSTGIWNRGVNSNEIGYTAGFIPRIQTGGFSAQDVGTNYFRIGVQQAADLKYSEIFADSNAAEGAIVSGLLFNYGGKSAKFGAIRGSNNTMSTVALMVDNSKKFDIAPADLGAINWYTSTFGINGSSPQVQLRNPNGQGIASIGSDQNAGTMSIWTQSGTSAQFRSNGLYYQGQTTGENGAMVSGQVDAGAWNDWKIKSAGVGISIATQNAAHNVWKATNWGNNHTAAMQVSHPSNQSDYAMARLVVFAGTGKADAGFQFAGNGSFTAASGAFANIQISTLLAIGDNDSGLRAKADGQVSLWSNNGEMGYYGQIPNVNLSGITTGIRLTGELMASSIHLTNESGARGLTFTVTPNQPASRVNVSAWGNTTGRSTVCEFADGVGYMFYVQRSSNNQVDVQSAGFFTLDNAADGFSFRALGRTLFYKGGDPVGGGGYDGQLNAMAPFYQKIDTRPNGDNNFYPLVKGRINVTAGYPLAYSFGVVTSGTTFPIIQIQAKTDSPSADRLWSFNPGDGSFNSPGTVFAGGARLATDGNIFGSAWYDGGANGWINNWVYANFVNQIAFGAVETAQVWHGYGFNDQPPFVITGARNDTADEYIDWVARRPLRYSKNGSWRDVGPGA
ncbi:MAG: hypothetical protein RR742_23960 [Citrobacter sp.]|uniref:hypothetical protein n=1 Tax=Citrobacter sp. TaxID=1896336 RepID=UPI002FC6F0B1